MLMPRAREDQKIEELLLKDHACYVLITCREPTQDGRMEVEMRYEGDRMLAAYLVESAQAVMEKEDE